MKNHFYSTLPLLFSCFIQVVIAEPVNQSDARSITITEQMQADNSVAFLIVNKGSMATSGYITLEVKWPGGEKWVDVYSDVFEERLAMAPPVATRVYSLPRKSELKGSYDVEKALASLKSQSAEFRICMTEFVSKKSHYSTGILVKRLK
jgi:hypothetical protein